MEEQIIRNIIRSEVESIEEKIEILFENQERNNAMKIGIIKDSLKERRELIELSHNNYKKDELKRIKSEFWLVIATVLFWGALSLFEVISHTNAFLGVIFSFVLVSWQMIWKMKRNQEYQYEVIREYFHFFAQMKEQFGK